jgi:hypothetical protein
MRHDFQVARVSILSGHNANVACHRPHKLAKILKLKVLDVTVNESSPTESAPRLSRDHDSNPAAARFF